jgi:protein associated with RNAse G/E
VDGSFAIPIPLISLAPSIAAGQSICAPNPVSARSLPIQTSSTESIVIQKREKTMWSPGEVVVWRGIYRNRVWHARTVFVIKDRPEETVVALLTGTECMMPKGYSNGKKNSRRRWDYKQKLWELETFHWHTNRLLCLLEPQRYYSTILFWHNESNKFLCCYINFQLPYWRSHCGIDTLDLDLDLIINPDYSYEWKDEDDYQKGIETEIILPEWIQGIEVAKHKIYARLEKRQYPFNGSGLDWMPDPTWSSPRLPQHWDKV